MQALPAFDPAWIQPPVAEGWQASLRLRVAARAGRSVLAERRHQGPLRIQKALYPEGPQTVQLLLIHPPGGIAGGDALDFDVAVESAAHAQITTPGAAKWYKANGRVARQDVRLNVAQAGVLEWLPQEAIHFDGCDVRQSLAIDCAPDARCIGWEVSVLGRRASRERFSSGRLHQDFSLRVAGQLQWRERSHLTGGDALLDSVVGWNGLHVAGTLWAYGATIDDTLLDACRAALPPEPGLHAGVTRRDPKLLLARVLADCPERARARLAALWMLLRPALTGRAAQPPRIWAT